MLLVQVFWSKNGSHVHVIYVEDTLVYEQDHEKKTGHIAWGFTAWYTCTVSWEQPQRRLKLIVRFFHMLVVIYTSILQFYLIRFLSYKLFLLISAVNL